MSAARPTDDRTLERTPALEALLQSLRRSICRQVLWYGLGTILGATALWLSFAFLADWGLRVPRAIRIFHGLALPVVIGFFAWPRGYRTSRTWSTPSAVVTVIRFGIPSG